MKKTVLITGASGFVGRHLIPILEEKYNIKKLTRTPNNINEYAWDVSRQYIDDEALDNVDYIIHLAGAKLNEGTPLTEERKKTIYESRIGAADFLRKKLIERKQNIIGYISASAIGYYGFTDKSIEIDENGHKGFGFNADLSADWEDSAYRWKNDAIANYVSIIRVSLVLGKDGGVLPIYDSMLKQNPNVINNMNDSYIPWNHVEDMAGIFAFALENHLDGIYNSVAPEPATVTDIYKAIINQKQSNKYKIIPYEGQHLISKKIEKAGYIFKYPNIELAINQIYNK